MDFNGIAGFIWSVADLLRGDYKQSDYGKVVLPFTLLRRLDCVLEPTKAAVLAEYKARKDSKLPLDTFLLRKSGQTFYNTSELDFARLLADPDNIRANCILPGWIMTERQIEKWLTPEGEAELMKRQCLKRRLQPAELAKFTVFLASDEASACTNQSYIVDGGWV